MRCDSLEKTTCTDRLQEKWFMMQDLSDNFPTVRTLSISIVLVCHGVVSLTDYTTVSLDGAILLLMQVQCERCTRFLIVAGK